MEIRIRNFYDDIRWDVIFTLLSMESVEPYLVEIGLPLSNPEAIRLTVRQFLEESESDEKATTQEVYFKQKADWLESAFKRIAEATDEQTAKALYRWGTEDFMYGREEEGDAHSWGNILSRLAGVYEQPINAPPLPPDKIEAIKEVVRKYLGDEYWRLHDEIDQLAEHPKSVWEEHLYRLYQSRNPDFPDDLGQLINLLTFIHDRRIREAWRAIKSILTAEELETFIEWAKAEETKRVRNSSLGAPPGGW